MKMVALGVDSSNTRGTDLTAGSAGSKGTEVSIGTCPFDADGFTIETSWTDTSPPRFYLDVLVKVGSSYYSLITDAYMQGSGYSAWGFFFNVPVKIPKSAAVYARVQCNIGSVHLYTLIHAWKDNGRLRTFHSCETLGKQTGTVGTPVTSGAANTKGSWTQLGTLGANIKALQFSFDDAADSANANLSYLLDVGIGPDSSTVTKIIADMPLFSHASPVYRASPNPQGPYYFPEGLPSGQKLWLKLASSGATKKVGVTGYCYR